MYINNSTAEESNEYSTDAEPVDPVDPDHEARRNTPLSQDPRKLVNAKPLSPCGCDSCPSIVDPLYDTDLDQRNDYWALEKCKEPRAMTVKEALSAYLTYQRSAYNSEDQRSSRYTDHRYGLYPRILSADRHFRNRYSGLTTVLFTRRLSPKDKQDEWIEPYLLDKTLHSNTVMGKVGEKMRYQLKNFNFEYIRVTATTETAATPHEHRYFWIDDPNNEISVGHFRNALEAHWKYVPSACRDKDLVDPEGQDGVITLRHDPPLVDKKPAKPEAIRRACEEMEGVDSRIKNTRGAQYLASQLPHIWLGDKFHAECEDPDDTLLEGGAIAWATPSRWFGASNGVPKLSD